MQSNVNRVDFSGILALAAEILVEWYSVLFRSDAESKLIILLEELT